jgi:long-chain fatty acid transport protein
MKKVCLLTASVLTASIGAMGGSFQLNLQGMRQTAMASSGVALPWDVSTIFFNPGGLSRLGGLQAYANVFVVSPKVKYVQTPTGNYTAETKAHVSTPFAVYVGGPVKKDSKLAIGLGIYTPFGSSANWGNDWTGRYITESISLSSIYMQPTVSYCINDRLSVGGGLVYGIGSVEIHKAIPIQDKQGQDGQAQLKGNAHGMGYNLGVQVKATDKLQLGIAYRSGVKMQVDKGDATFQVPASVAANFPNTDFSTQLPLPAIFTVGAGYKISEKLTVQGDVIWAGWHTYDSLRFDFKDNTAALKDTRDARAYKNTVAVRVGAHYAINKTVAVMAGAAYDPTPTQSNLLSPDAVDANRINLTCGASLQPTKKLTVLAALYYTTTAKRTVTYDPANFSGAYQIKSLVPGSAVSYNF